MASVQKIPALRGMRDVFSAEYGQRKQIKRNSKGICAAIHLCPSICRSWKIPNSICANPAKTSASRLYEFDFKSRRIALRPELTASILRAYVEHLQDEPLPLRIQYAGPVFRYEKPQQNRFRQFTVAGAELLGAGRGRWRMPRYFTWRAAECRRWAFRNYRLVVGHSEVLEGFCVHWACAGNFELLLRIWKMSANGAWIPSLILSLIYILILMVWVTKSGFSICRPGQESAAN